MTLNQWIEKVDAICLRVYGVTSDDLGGGYYHDAWSQGVTPEQFFADNFTDSLGSFAMLY